MSPRTESRSIPAEFPGFVCVHPPLDRCSISLDARHSSECTVDQKLAQAGVHAIADNE
jgi:hypothetical protein